jgi:hypothetical protein
VHRDGRPPGHDRLRLGNGEQYTDSKHDSYQEELRGGGSHDHSLREESCGPAGARAVPDGREASREALPAQWEPHASDWTQPQVVPAEEVVDCEVGSAQNGDRVGGLPESWHDHHTRAYPCEVSQGHVASSPQPRVRPRLRPSPSEQGSGGAVLARAPRPPRELGTSGTPPPQRSPPPGGQL